MDRVINIFAALLCVAVLSLIFTTPSRAETARNIASIIQAKGVSK